ncbi:DsrE/DsrF/DrsH-like family protein [Phycicoccus sp.]|uniref:DsrE/DsrF/DrsH-like family protein n=1 Tax=Phycicoccus sp. TaxID=1902410 RepID=UPI002C1F8078|nr:DsrE/DsrF/DrsH-like family protein [Phycicoccus sp.]HMM96101.1 DsrE/DsrF/DrsH-like family protein [Phycicoccus sp.]
MTAEPVTTDRSALTEDDVRRIVKEELGTALRKDPGMRTGAIVASKGTLDWAYPPLILANAAAAVGMQVSVFFTFYGLNIVHRDFERKLKVDPVGNPAMPMPVPMPDLVTAMPGMVSVASRMMKKKFADKKVSSIGELIETAREMDVRLIACQMTVDVFGFEQSDFLDGVEFGGAAAFMAEARKSNLTLFV